MFLLGRSCPSLLIGNNNRCPWSASKNNPATDGREARPESAAGEHPGREAGSWPWTSTGLGIVGTSPTPRLACLIPPEISPRLYEISLGNSASTHFLHERRDQAPLSKARQGNALGRGPPWTITLRCIMCFASHEVHPAGHGMAQRGLWTSWIPWELAVHLGEQHTPP